jgi:hypothetical protein
MQARQRGFRDGSIEVEPIKLSGLLYLFDRWLNITELCIAIHRHFDGRPYIEPSLRSRTPVRGFEEKIDREIPSVDEILAAINADQAS